MSTECETCGSPMSGLGTQAGALAEHVLNYHDPHHTLDLVPTVEVGLGNPGSAEGKLGGSLYIDLLSRVAYVVVGPDGAEEWRPATSAQDVTRDSLASTLAGYVTIDGLRSTLSGYVQTSSAAGFARVSDLTAYATRQSVTDMLSGYVTAEDLARRGFVTSASLAGALSGYVSSVGLSGALSQYITSAESDARYASRSELAGYVRSEDRESFLSGVVRRQSVGPGSYPETDLDVILQGYLSTEEAESTYATKSWVNGLRFVTENFLTSALSGYVSSESLSTTLLGYLTPSDGDRRYVLASSVPDIQVLPSGYEGLVFRPPSAPGTYPERNLDVVLQGYLTTSAASSTYATKSWVSSLGYVTSAAVDSVLAEYVTRSLLQTALSGFLTSSAADARYVTPAYLASHGYVQSGGSGTSNYVYRLGDGAERDIDSILGSWPIQTIDPIGTRPVSSSTVYAALASRDTAISGLRSRLAAISVTGGSSYAMNVITDPQGIPGNPSIIPVLDSVCNTIEMAGSWISGLTNGFSVAVPDGVDGVCRDFFVVLDFPESAGTGPVQVRFNGFVSSSGGPLRVFSYTNSGLFSMDGVAYGMMVVFAVTGIAPGVLSVTRKNMYEV